MPRSRRRQAAVIEQRLSEPKTDPDIPELSQRQAEILHLLMSGKPNKEIATQLGIGLGTVKQHMVALFKKLNVTSRAMAISKGFAINGRTAARPLTARHEVEGQMEIRPAAVLSLSATSNERGAAAAADAWNQLRRAAADATASLDATLIGRTGSGVDIIVGLHHAYEDNAIKAARVARTVARVLQDEMPEATLRAGLSSGYLTGSMQRRGGWTGETVAGRLIGSARDLCRDAQAGHLLIDARTRRMMAFAQRREVAEQGEATTSWPLSDPDLPTVPGKPVLPALIGRTRERNQLAEIRQMLARRAGGLVWIEGEAGMGKTTLCRAFGQECEALGFDWAEADCKDPDLGLAAALARIADVSADTAPTDAADFLAAVTPGLECKLAPQVILIDDVHLADEFTIKLIQLLVPMTRKKPILLLGASRSLRHRGLVALTSDATIRLGHLADGEMEALIKARCGSSVSSQIVAGIRELAGGVPLFAVELAREARMRAPAGRSISTEMPPVPLSLVTLVLSRLDTLALDRLLLRSAVQRGPCLRTTLESEWDGSPAGFTKALDDAIQSGVLTTIQDKKRELIAFRHPLLVQVLRQVMLAEELEQFQRMLGAQIAVANR
jgi:DNA-binding CsgD family transcriptional regulator